jgi:hypothetical protein
MHSGTQVNGEEGDIAKGLQDSFSGGTVGALILSGWIEADNGFISVGQLAAEAKFEQDNETQGQEKQPGQASNALLIMEENRTNVEITTLEAGNALLQAGLSAIGQHEVRVRIEAGGGIAEIDLPTESLNHLLPGGFIALISSHQPALPTSLVWLGLEGNGDKAIEVIAVEQRRHFLSQFLLVVIPFTPLFGWPPPDKHE